MRTISMASVALIIGLAAAACGSSPNSNTTGGSSGTNASHPLKVGFILDGSITDGGYNTAVYQGIQDVQRTFGSKVQVIYKQNVPESPASTQVINSLIQSGANMVVSTSYGYHTYISEAAKANPKVKFLQNQATGLAANLSEYYLGIDQAQYLAGMAAGGATKNGRIGMVASFPTPGLLAQVDAFELGVRAVNPSATTRVVWLDSWFDPAKSTLAAQGLVSSGVDVLANALDDGSVVQVAEKDGIPVLGHDADQNKYAPKYWLTGAEFLFGPYFVQQIRELLNGTWKSDNYYGLMKDQASAIAQFGSAYYKDVSKSIQAKIQQKKQELMQGTFDDLSGPIYNQAGKLVVPAGKTMTVAQKEQINYLVKGVIGSTS